MAHLLSMRSDLLFEIKYTPYLLGTSSIEDSLSLNDLNHFLYFNYDEIVSNLRSRISHIVHIYFLLNKLDSEYEQQIIWDTHDFTIKDKNDMNQIRTMNEFIHWLLSWAKKPYSFNSSKGCVVLWFIFEKNIDLLNQMDDSHKYILYKIIDAIRDDEDDLIESSKLEKYLRLL